MNRERERYETLGHKNRRARLTYSPDTGRLYLRLYDGDDTHRATHSTHPDDRDYLDERAQEWTAPPARPPFEAVDPGE